ncbi:phosphoribosyltransferase family protein [Patescibacteria group bacterium]
MSDNNFYPLTWEHYGLLVEDLWKDLKSKLESENIAIDAVVAILREGVFTAMPLAYKLNTYKIFTVQYKYVLFDGGNELKKISGMSESIVEVPEEPIFLLCDTFPCGGKTKFLAVDDIKKRYPKAKFIFASLVQDHSVEDHEDFITSAYAFDVNDKWETTHPLFVKLGIESNALNVFLPWENADEEDAAVNQKEWKYN